MISSNVEETSWTPRARGLKKVLNVSKFRFAVGLVGRGVDYKALEQSMDALRGLRLVGHVDQLRRGWWVRQGLSAGYQGESIWTDGRVPDSLPIAGMFVSGRLETEESSSNEKSKSWYMRDTIQGDSQVSTKIEEDTPWLLLGREDPTIYPELLCFQNTKCHLTI